MAFPSCATEIHAILEPTDDDHQSTRAKDYGTDDIEEQLVLKDVETLDDVFVVHDPKEHDLHGNFSQGIVVDPCLFRHFGFDHKLDCDFQFMSAM